MSARHGLRGRLFAGREYGWGFVDQALASATSFILVLLAGRALGPSGLGVVTLGFLVTLLALGFQRSLLTTPLVSSVSARAPSERMQAVRAGLTTQAIGALATSALFLALGLALPGSAGRALLIFAPWVGVVLLQEFWRAILFQEARARGAAGNDLLRAAVMLAAAVPAWHIGTDWAIVGAWGAGAAAGGALGFLQVKTWFIAPLLAVAWWRTHLLPFGSWLALESALYSVAEAVTMFVLNGILGPAAVGGLRAAQSIFAPLNLVLPAITLPGLPAVSRALAASADSALRLAGRISAFVALLATVYVTVMVAFGGTLIPFVFGESFSAYDELAVPIGVWQIAAGVGAGFAIFLVAMQRGRQLVVVRAGGAGVSLVAVILLAWTSGVTGAAWGFAVAAVAATALTIMFALRSRRVGGPARVAVEPGTAGPDATS